MATGIVVPWKFWLGDRGSLWGFSTESFQNLWIMTKFLLLFNFTGANPSASPPWTNPAYSYRFDWKNSMSFFKRTYSRIKLIFLIFVQTFNALNLSTTKFKSVSAGTTRRGCRPRVVADRLYLACPYDLVGFFHLPFVGWLLDERRLKSSNNLGFQV